MKLYTSKTIPISLLLVVGLVLLMPSFQPTLKDALAAQPDKMPALTSPEEVDRYLAGMSDEQVRQAYAQKLKQEAADKASARQRSEKRRPTNKVFASFYGAAQAITTVLSHVETIFTGEETDIDSGRWGAEVAKLSDGQGAPYLLGTIAGLAVIIALGLVLRWLFGRTTSNIHENILKAVRLGKLQFFGRAISRALLEAVGIGVYVLATFVIFVIFFKQGKANYVIVSTYLIVSYYIMVFAFGARIIFSPQTAALRLFPMQDRDASFLYKWILRITVIAGFFAGASTIFSRLNVSQSLYLLTYGLAGVVVIVAIVIMIWQSRKRVGEAIGTGDVDQASGGGSLRAALARNWHYFATLYVLIAGAIWVVKALEQENVTVVNLILSIFLIPIVIGADQWVQRLLKIASGESRETIDLSSDHPPESGEQQEAAGKMDIEHYIPLIRRGFRIFLIAFIFFISLRLWGIDVSFGRLFARDALSIVAVVLLSFIAWQLIKARIDKRLREEMPEANEDAEEGSAGGTRMGTLLVLLRKFVLTVMFVIVTLLILAAMGVNIGPLIAGAGVVGLALGFGAQTLVKDIIAGVFFLMDDAFRVGDYIETSGSTGMVEHISLRSLRLRSARGPVHTIPFGDMGTVTNMSRDYIVMKLDFRVRYDTNVDKVRKIIKKIYQKIEEDEELGPKLLGKIKSQGVKQLDDSAMVMRVKYKTKPGDQFVIRRELFRMIQESFRQNGIEFAHRNVTVYMPPGDEAGAAAAIAAAQEKPK